MPDDAALPFLTMTRRLRASPEAVFAAWTETEKLKKWWGPHTCTCPHAELDVRPGGAWRACIRNPDGNDIWVGGTYETVEPPRKLSFTWAWDQEDGSPGDESLVEIEFVEQDGATEMRFQHSGFKTADIRDGHNEGWTSSFLDLENYINGEIS